MITYADPRVCPSCREPLPQPVPPSHRCTTCTVLLGHQGAADVFAALQRVDTLVARLRATSWAPVPGAVPVGATQRPGPPVLDREPVIPPLVQPAPTVAPTAAPAAVRTGVRTSSVPAILLTLGALCLLVAAVTFLAVAWSWLGVGGRTTVLVVLTLATAAGGLALRGRGLRVAAESLVTVSLGMLILDVLGADAAGWVGGPDGLPGPGLALTVGLVLTAGGAALSIAEGRLVVPQLAGVLGLFVAQAALPSLVDHDLLVAALATVGFVALTATLRHAGLTAAAWGAATAAVLTWLDLVLTSLVALGSVDSLTVHDLWASDAAPGLLAAAVLVLAPSAVVRAEVLIQLCAISSALMLTGLAVLPVLDGSATEVALASLVAGGLWTVLAYTVPQRRLAVPLVPAVLSLMPATLVAVALAGQALGSTLTPTADLRLDPADPVASTWLLVPTALMLGTVALVLVPAATRRAGLVRSARVVLAAGLVAAVATLALHPVPLWTVVAALTLAASAYVGDALLRSDTGALAQTLVACGTLLATVGIASPSTGLLLVPLSLLAGAAGATMLIGRFPAAAPTGGTLLGPSLAAVTWVLGDLAGLDAYRAVPVLVVLAALALGRSRPEVEVPSAVCAALAALGAVALAGDTSLSLALHLTLTGALVVAHALVHPSRRRVAAVGTALLVLATWVRLGDLGVTAAEAYTMPTAVLLVAVGLWRMRRDGAASTALALLPGLALATVPSFLQVLGSDPVSMRAALLGTGCLVLMVGGAQLRWSAPLLVGAVVGGLLTLLELAPYAAATPQWVVIAIAGTTLVVVGTTWERRVVDLQRASQYVGRLR